ncbi:hypothetical protein MMC08_007847 [Hypocenomyce scalaris]|nr:hypothetical protein [Hypocenomyce scalaris]
MFAKTLLLAITAAGFAAAIPASPLEKRVTHTGTGTVYLQEGATGSCGEKNPDSAVIAALSNYWMEGESPSAYCGRKIRVTNTGSNDDGVGGAGNVVVVTVEDTCESCGEGDVDFSVGAWDQLTDRAAYGTFEASW